jgi:hypothetical protein
MKEPSIEASPVPLTVYKEAYTGVAGRLCRYVGDADNGLQIELSPGDLLTVTPAQIQQIFADLSAYNRLLEDTRGLHESPSIIQSIKAAARARRDAQANRANPESRRDPFSHLVSPRFAAWLNANDLACWNRSIGNQQAAYLQAAFCGEGLLPLQTNRPGDFPVAGILTSLQALVGKRVIYEERPGFALVELMSVTTTDSDQVYLTLSNLEAPGFAADFPERFGAGGSLEDTHMSDGAIAGYMGTWKLITSPRAVARICELAPELDRRGLWKLCRKVEYGHGKSSVY